MLPRALSLLALDMLGRDEPEHRRLRGLVDKDQRRRLQDGMSLMPLCVEECLRHVSPVQLTKPRWAAHDTTPGGHDSSAAKARPRF